MIVLVILVLWVCCFRTRGRINNIEVFSLSLFESTNSLLFTPLINFFFFSSDEIKRAENSQCIPYLGLLLRDLTYANDGSPDFLGKVRVSIPLFSIICILFFFSQNKNNRISTFINKEDCTN